MEKNDVHEMGSPTYPDEYVQSNGQESHKAAISEGAELYGNVEEAEEYGYVTRG